MQFQKDAADRPSMKWSATDHTFEKDGEDITVLQYYKKAYDIDLKYPNMPLVRTGGSEYFPVEFLFQEMSRVPNSNDAEKVKEVLGYHDNFSGPKRIEHISAVKELASGKKRTSDRLQSLTDWLEEFSIVVGEEPIILQARRIQAPKLSFANTVETRNDVGSWNLARKMFQK